MEIKNLLKDPQTNWKYIVIVVILAAIVGGGILVYSKGVVKDISIIKFSEIEKLKKTIKGESDELINSLKNAEYYCELCNMMVEFNNGYYYTKEYPNNETAIRIGIFENKAAFGDLNNDNRKDAAVILDSRWGGNAHFYELAIVINKNGKLYYLTSKQLGDRVEIHSIIIESGIIIIDITTHGFKDPMCCPTQRKIVKYKLFGDQLEKIKDETVDWQTYKNEKYGFEFKYPEELDQIYIKTHPAKWPPVIIVGSVDPDFICEEFKSQPGYGPPREQKEIIFNNSKYCLLTITESGMGSVYVYYTYITNRNNRQLTIEFILRFPSSCEVRYGIDNKMKECEIEQNTFDPNIIVDKILSTFRFLE